MATTFKFETVSKDPKAAPSKQNVLDARDWFRDTAAAVKTVPGNKGMAENRDNLVSSINAKSIGRMYMFFYDPKTKDTLPYYDHFPLVFPFKLHNDGFTGLNLHYISPLLRARLMDSFYNVMNNNRMDETTKIRLNYGMMKSASKYKFYKPCVKRYLFSHVRSRYLQVPITSWDTALFLPTERFTGANKAQVFKDSRAIIYGS